jgi:hypothetical protein
MKQNLLRFEYTLLNHSGTCYAVSVAQALDRARSDYAQACMNSGPPGTSGFRLAKSKLAAYTPILTINSIHLKTAERIYRELKDGVSNQHDLDTADHINRVVKDLKNLK